MPIPYDLQSDQDIDLEIAKQIILDCLDFDALFSKVNDRTDLDKEQKKLVKWQIMNIIGMFPELE